LKHLGGRNSISNNSKKKIFPQYHHQHTTMKIVGIAVVRTGKDLNEPIPLTFATDLSSFGFFQRQVCHVMSAGGLSVIVYFLF